MKTYEIVNVSFEHPTLGTLNKQSIIYRESETDPGTPEFYDSTVEIRAGYKKLNAIKPNTLGLND